MKTKFKKVAVLLGGDSSEREISLKSGQMVLKSLQHQDIQATAIDPKYESIYALKTAGFDAAFIVLHGGYGENGVVQSILQYQGIPYTGSRTLACALAMDKHLTKKVWQQAGLPVCDEMSFQKSQMENFNGNFIVEQLGMPLIVKPNANGSSCGISIVDTVDQLPAALAEAFTFDEKVLIEPFLCGAEYNVSIIADKAYPSIRVDTPRAFYDYTAKYLSNDTQYLIPSGLDREEENKIKQQSLDAFYALGGEGWGRIDWIKDSSGKMFLLEANMVPGMTQSSLVPKAAMYTGMHFDAVVKKILDQAY